MVKNMVKNTVKSVVMALALSLTGACAHSPEGGRPEGIRLDSGLVKGVHDGDVHRYRGIPYARPPVGNLRWRPPQPVAHWSGTRDAARSGPACPQAGSSPAESSDKEDCLYLDVTVPDKGGASKPVMVWLHGGGFTAGAGSAYDPRRLAVTGDVIVVTVEFRLGTLGYAALPGMPGGGSFGRLDQQAALRWVKRNAKAFGGDPGNVTLFGESGGGVAVCGQLASPSGAGLFDKAIMQSGACGTTLLPGAAAPGSPASPFWRSRQEAYQATMKAAKALGCPGDQPLDCLRRQPVSKLLGQTGLFTAAVGDPVRDLEAGRFHRVPVLSGHTKEEALLFASVANLLGKPVTDDNLDDLLVQGFGGKAAAVRRAYPREGYPSAAENWAAAYTDAIFACPHVRADTALARHTKVYGYEFADETAPPFIPSLPGFRTGAGHASELAYLFDVKDKPISLEGKHVPLTATQRAVADGMVKAWTTFARTGSPGKGWPEWDGRVRVITSEPGSGAVERAAVSHKCDFWTP
ncbi:carboxylesterase/lipase family protein [Nonomuraea rhizosphaerae]|uniref:carboxylesterase/lipase family protein n=1 Tax=Nonomuraea rhizosphaerae TaxID=2665663 RepID=UPI001C5FCF6A|nr:carboxylesterase family protein [Nonomuraea rhizosphaerae]